LFFDAPAPVAAGHPDGDHVVTEPQNNPGEKINPVENDVSAADAPAAEAADTAALQAQIEQLQQQVADAKDQALRAAAEAQNVRRRAEKDVENAHKFALEKFAGSLLPIADNLERTLEVADRNNEALKPLLEGVELTRKTLLDVLGKFQIEQLDPLGAPFDPQFHEAVSMVDNPAAEPNSVLHVMQKGFLLNGRLLRAAMVVVARGSAKKVDETA
jgi:molecular chaperone GrpE